MRKINEAREISDLAGKPFVASDPIGSVTKDS